MSSESSKNSFNSIGSLEIPIQEVNLDAYVSGSSNTNEILWKPNDPWEQLSNTNPKSRKEGIYNLVKINLEYIGIRIKHLYSSNNYAKDDWEEEKDSSNTKVRLKSIISFNIIIYRLQKHLTRKSIMTEKR